MEEDLRAVLTASPAVQAAAPGGVHWAEIPQGKPLPALVLHLIDGSEGMTLSGGDGLEQGRVQADAIASSFAEALALRRAVSATLHGYRAGRLKGVFEDGRRHDRAGGSNDADRPFRASADFLFNWSDDT